MWICYRFRSSSFIVSTDHAAASFLGTKNKTDNYNIIIIILWTYYGYIAAQNYRNKQQIAQKSTIYIEISMYEAE